MARKRARGRKRSAIGGANWALLVGRVLIGLLFILGGYWKLVSAKGAAASMAHSGVPLAAEWLAIVAGVIAILGGLAIVVGWYTRVAAIVMLVLLLPWTWYLNLAPAWDAGLAKLAEAASKPVLVKLALMGAMLLLCITGPGKISINKKN